MKFVIYVACNDSCYGCFEYITVLDTFEEAVVLKDELEATKYYFDGVLFVGTEEGLEEASIKTWYNHKHIKEVYPDLHKILVKNDYFGAPSEFK